MAHPVKIQNITHWNFKTQLADLRIIVKFLPLGIWTYHSVFFIFADFFLADLVSIPISGENVFILQLSLTKSINVHLTKT